MNIQIEIPFNVKLILNQLDSNGFQSYIVGGCVRDSLLRLIPKDYDICTSALPEQVIELFMDYYNVIETGIKHGTVTVMIDDIGYEITTFRLEGKYLNNRHPDTIEFTDDLIEDLSRRDFTIGAMAYHPRTGIIDPFNGQEDLKNRIIRCVGSADDRLKEDALRMLRCLRFSARFNFSIHSDTYRAIYDNSHLIQSISIERIQSEFNQIIMNNPVFIDILNELQLLKYFLPELCNCVGVKQINSYHKFDVYNHILESVRNIEAKLYLRLTMLFHDIAKPIALSTDEKGINHFYGHQKVSADMAVEILRRMRYDNYTIMAVRDLVEFHDCDIPANKKSIKRWLNKIGENKFRDLLKVKKADMMAQSQLSYELKHKHLEELEILLEEVLQEAQCFSKKDLAINGRDLIDIGFKEGKEIGIIIDKLVEMVIDNPELNTKDKLLKIINLSLTGF